MQWYNYTIFSTLFRILVTAVDKSTSNLKLKFFNNCFDDEFSTGKHSNNSSRQVDIKVLPITPRVVPIKRSKGFRGFYCLVCNTSKAKSILKSHFS